MNVLGISLLSLAGVNHSSKSYIQKDNRNTNQDKQALNKQEPNKQKNLKPKPIQQETYVLNKESKFKLDTYI